jgi:hypothetical protein
MTRLKYLTLEKLIDTAYFCGIGRTPVFLIIAAPPGAGKTWCTSSISETDFVLYMNKPYSPAEHRKIIAKHAPRMRLFINDDLSLSARWNAKEYFATFCMIYDGEVVFTQWKSTIQAHTRCSMVLCCTTEYYHANRDDMTALGLLDRLIPIVLELSSETRKKYQSYIQDTSVFDNTPVQRDPVFKDARTVKKGIISKKDIDPRLLLNIRRMSQFLTDDETEELIAVAHSNGKYEI